MAASKILLFFSIISASIFLLNATSEEVRSCEVEGKVYQEHENFAIGVDGCAKCVCAENAVKCDSTKCQEILSSKVESQSMETIARSNETEDDFTNIKNQIMKQYFSEFDAAKLAAIKAALGCNSTGDCPKLLSSSEIQYDLTKVVGRKYLGRGDRISKVVIQSIDTEVVNSSPSPQTVITVPYSLTLTQYSEVIIKKTRMTSSKNGVNVILYKQSKEVTFTETNTTKITETNTTTIGFPSQNVTINPSTRLNVTFDFFQFDDVNNYFIDLEIALDSVISHPDVDDNANVVVEQKPLGDFLLKNVEFLSTMTYPNDKVVKIEAVTDDDGKRFVLRNFPTTETITSFGVDVGYGHAVKA